MPHPGDGISECSVCLAVGEDPRVSHADPAVAEFCAELESLVSQVESITVAGLQELERTMEFL